MAELLRAYALGPGEGWTYRAGVDFAVKVCELGPSRFAVLEYTTSDDEWPGHTHRTEDEAFYVLKGSLTFRCGDEEFDVDEGGFIFLPHGIQHGYKLRDGGEAHLLVITAPAGEGGAEPGWGGFIGGIESGDATLVSRPAV